MKRRARKTDLLANKKAVREILRKFAGKVFPDGISDKRLRNFLFAIQHVERRTATSTNRGRASHWDRTFLVNSANVLREILNKETEGRLTLLRFIAKYVSLLAYPADVVEPLECGSINLEEAHLLARLTPNNLEVTGQAAYHRRQALLKTHLERQDSQNALRQRVADILEKTTVNTAVEMSQEVKRRVSESDEMLEFDASDSTHLLWEEIKNSVFMMKEIESEDLDDKLIDEILTRNGELQNSLQKVLRLKAKRVSASTAD